MGPSTFADLTKTMKRLGVSHLFTVTRDSIKCNINDSQFLFTGLRTNTEDNVKSRSGVDYVWIEEAATITEEVWNILDPTIREKHAKIIITFNPRLESDFMTTHFITCDTLPPRTVVVKINYDDNIYFSNTSLVEGMEHMKEHDFPMYTHVYGGECLNQGDNKIFSSALVQEAVKRVPVLEPQPVIAAVDLARFGGDSTVMCIREGNKFHELKKWKDKEVDEMVEILAGEVISNKIDVIIMDAAGLGVGHFAYLRKAVGNICKVVEYNSNNTPQDKKRFANARAETHFLAKEAMEHCNIPTDLELRKQLINIEYTYHKVNNKLLVELKEKYKDRNAGNSPDELDSFTQTFYKGWISRELDKSKLRGRRR